MIRKQILPTLEHPKENRLEKVKAEIDKKKLTFNIAYY